MSSNLLIIPQVVQSAGGSENTNLLMNMSGGYPCKPVKDNREEGHPEGHPDAGYQQELPYPPQPQYSTQLQYAAQPQYPTQLQYPAQPYPPPTVAVPPAVPQYGGYGGDPPPPYSSTINTQPYGETCFTDPGITQFNDATVRRSFIKKVYSILFVQLLVSIGIVCLFILHDGVRTFVQSNRPMFYSAWILTLVIMIAIGCCEKPRRMFPLNVVLLSLFTLCDSYLLGVISAYYQTEQVFLAMIIVAVLAFGITMFAFQTKVDFTAKSGCIFVAGIVLICFGFLTIFFYSRVLRLVYASLGALVFGFYLIFDTQMMLGGQKQYSLSPEEYIFAALNLYIDIVTMFMFILSMMKRRGK